MCLMRVVYTLFLKICIVWKSVIHHFMEATYRRKVLQATEVGWLLIEYKDHCLCMSNFSILSIDSHKIIDS